MIWPDFCSALIVGRLAPLGLHKLGFGPFRCPVAQGPVQTLRVPPRDPPERRQFQVPQIVFRQVGVSCLVMYFFRV